MMSQLHRRLLFAALLICALLVTSGAFAQRVVINGSPLVTSLSPQSVGGSMLLPMRDVFVALGAEIKWFAAEQKIVAVRGQTTIELWIGRPMATLNGQPMNLPVAPMLYGGSTYVPLRFPAEAFGGTIKWDGPTQTAFIDIPPAGAVTPPVGPVVPPVVPEAAKPRNIDGTVIQIVPNPAGIVLQTNDNVSGLLAVALDGGTVITRGVVGAAAQAATVADIRVGDYAQATMLLGNLASRLTLSYGQAAGKVLAIANNTLFLDTGTAYQLSNQVRLLNQAGAPVALSAIAAGSPAQITFEPRSKAVWEVRLTGQPTTTAATGKPQILTVGLLNNTAFFKRGDPMDVQVTGTPGGQATVTLGKLARDLPMQEITPGSYRARYIVPEGPDQIGMLLTANLSVGGVAADSLRAQARFGVDNTGPVVSATLPANGEAISNAGPTIQVLLTEKKGAPVDPRSASMTVNGVNVSAELSVSEDDITYFAPDLPRGLVSVTASVRDTAGNQTQVSWSFTIGANTNGVLQAAWQDARGVLVAGDTVLVNARVLRPGGIASFRLGNLVQQVPMQLLPGTLTYRGSYVVRPGDRLVDGIVTVFYRDPTGLQGTLDAVNRLNINSGLSSSLSITSPLDGSLVGDTILITGTARPRSRVRVTINYTGRIITTITGQLWTGIVSASREGLWTTPEVSSSIGFLGRADSYTVKAELLDAWGATTSQQQIILRK
ncbi:MAG: stalk domain-containing protein [Armatimonadota bacterium]